MSMTKSATGVEGCLIRGHDGTYYFRVYDADHNFQDYDVMHSDLTITITDPDAFYIKTDAPNGLKHFVRSPIKTAMEGDFETGNVRYKARERYSFGWSDPRSIYGSQGA